MTSQYDLIGPRRHAVGRRVENRACRRLYATASADARPHSAALGTLKAPKDIVSPQSACILFTNALAKRSGPSWLGPQLACGGHHIDERGTHLLPPSRFQSAVGIDPELPIGNSLPRQHNQLLDFRRCGNAR